MGSTRSIRPRGLSRNLSPMAGHLAYMFPSDACTASRVGVATRRLQDLVLVLARYRGVVPWSWTAGGGAVVIGATVPARSFKGDRHGGRGLSSFPADERGVSALRRGVSFAAEGSSVGCLCVVFPSGRRCFDGEACRPLLRSVVRSCSLSLSLSLPLCLSR